jgi:hypothetical protein
VERNPAAPLRTTLARLLGLHTDERAPRRGRSGERVTAWWLGRLPEGWHLVNDVPVGVRGENIDHVITGPPGVFTVNAKNLTGKVWVAHGEVRHNGHKTDFVRKALSEASRASMFLSASIGSPVVVRPVLAILADDWTAHEALEEVFVGSPRAVKDWLRGLPPELASQDVGRIAAAAADLHTWRVTDGVRPV